MKKLLFLILIAMSCAVHAQTTITTSAVPQTSYCLGSSFDLAFTASGTYGSGNIFTAQMSDASGDFTSPTTVGSLSSTTSGSITVNIPSSIDAGTGYRFRVIGSDPSTTGSDNGSDITLNATPTATQPGDMFACTAEGVAVFFLPQQTELILDGQDPATFEVSYFTSMESAESNTDAILNPSSYEVTETVTVYARVSSIPPGDCYAITSFELTILAEPEVDQLDDVMACESYTLPELTNGNYFTDLNGTGTAYFAGDVIVSSMLLYIFNNPNAPDGCSATSEFQITILEGQVYYADADGDDFGNPEETIFACEEPDGYASNNTDCDDTDSTAWQTAQLYVDQDMDGYSSGATQSVCFGDFIPDGYLATETETDCDDTMAGVNPGATEIALNGIDDDCNGTIDEGSQILSQVLASQCGTTLNTLSSLIQAVSIGGQVDGYRFKVVNASTLAEQTIDCSVPHFQLNQLASYDYATTYNISVQCRYAGQWLNYYGQECQVSTPNILGEGGAAALIPAQCGTTLSALNSPITTTSIWGVSGYRFRITDTTTNEQQILDRTTQWFTLPMLSSFVYGHTYTVEVAVKTNGTYTGFGQACEITTPAVPQLVNCGAVLASGSTPVQTSSMNQVTSYRFMITNLNTSNSVIIDRSTHYFFFNNVPDFIPAGQYSISVALRTAGQWSDFSAPCVFTAPGTPESDIIARNESALPSVTLNPIAYPNPYSGTFALDISSPSEENVHIKVYDMLGKLIEDREFTSDVVTTHQFGETYPSGVYNVIVSRGNSVKTLRVIKR